MGRAVRDTAILADLAGDAGAAHRGVRVGASRRPTAYPRRGGPAGLPRQRDRPRGSRAAAAAGGRARAHQRGRRGAVLGEPAAPVRAGRPPGRRDRLRHGGRDGASPAERAEPRQLRAGRRARARPGRHGDHGARGLACLRRRPAGRRATLVAGDLPPRRHGVAPGRAGHGPGLDVPARDHDGPRAGGRELAQAARAAAGDGASPVLLSLLAAREAVGLAQAQDSVGASAAVAEARRWLDLGRRGDEPLWLDFWSPADLACHETRTALALGRPQIAERAARAALASADRDAFPRNHTIYTVRLASVLTRVGQLDEAIDVTSRAVQNADLLRGIAADQHRPPAHGRPPGPAVVRAGTDLRDGGAPAPGRRVTSGERGTVLDDLTITVYRRGTALAEIDAIAPIYASAYAEAPYHEGPDDVAEFRAGWPRRVAQPSFRLVVARLAGRARRILVRPPAHHRHAVVGRDARRRRAQRWSPSGRGGRSPSSNWPCKARCAAMASRANSTLICWLA